MPPDPVGTRTLQFPKQSVAPQAVPEEKVENPEKIGENGCLLGQTDAFLKSKHVDSEWETGEFQSKTGDVELENDDVQWEYGDFEWEHDDVQWEHGDFESENDDVQWEYDDFEWEHGDVEWENGDV